MRVSLQRISPEQLEYVGLILLAALVGVLGALGNLGFRALIELCSRLFLKGEWDALGIPRGGLFALVIPLVLLSGGAGVLILERLFPGEVMGYGFPNFIEMVNLGSAKIKRRWIFVKAAATSLSLGSGASVGREGPIAQIGGAIGSAVAQLASLSAERRKVLVACGAGAGIATTFNAPIGGLMFAQEIVLLGETELANLTLLVIATASGVVVSRAISGNAAVFAVPPFVLRSYWETFSYTLMGLGIGLLSAAYIRMFHATAGFFSRLKLAGWTKLSVGLLAVGLIATALPGNLSDGYPIIDLALAGRLSVHHMTALTAAKMVASSISLACGAPGGVFGPIFFIGTMAGGSFRALSARLAPGVTGPRGSYALVGLGAFLGSTTHAPMTAIFLLFEMTQDYQIALPAMLSTIIALVVARSVERESIDTYALARQGKTLQISKDRLVLRQTAVSAVMSRDVQMVSDSDSLHDILSAAGNTAQSTLPVVDSEGDLRGLIVLHDLLAIIAAGTDFGPLVNAYDICRRNCPVVMPASNLEEASQLMESEGLDELAVVERRPGGKLLGVVTRSAIVQALNRAAVTFSTLGGGDVGIFWSTGYRLARISIPPAAAGKTLRGLDPRAHFGVSVMALQDVSDPGAGFTTVDPDRPFKSGDLIIAAGRAPSLRRFQRQLEGEG